MANIPYLNPIPAANKRRSIVVMDLGMFGGNRTSTTQSATKFHCLLIKIRANLDFEDKREELVLS